MMEDYFSKAPSGKKKLSGYRSAPLSQMYSNNVPSQAEPRRCPSPPPGGGVRGADLDEVEVRASEELYRRATWRMYHRITAARIQSEKAEGEEVEEEGEAEGGATNGEGFEEHEVGFDIDGVEGKAGQNNNKIKNDYNNNGIMSKQQEER